MVDRSTWEIPAIFRLIGELGGVPQADLERTLNLGVGMIAVVDPSVADAAVARLNDRGLSSWVLGTVQKDDRSYSSNADYVQGAKGVDGGAAVLLNQYR